MPGWSGKLNANDKDVLIIPGWGDSGPEHWQTWLHQRHPQWKRVVQKEWIHVDPADWITMLNSYIAQCSGPPVLVAHSLSCILVARWAALGLGSIAGALLVAPTDIERKQTAPQETWCFAPIPRERLPFPSIVVASTTDPYTDLATAQVLAASWRSEFTNIGAAGHINSASGHGPWPVAEHLVGKLLG